MRVTLLITTTIGRRSWTAWRIALSVFTCISYNIIKGNVSECLKGIGLETIFRNILWENDKAINFFLQLFIFHMKVVSKLS